MEKIQNKNGMLILKDAEGDYVLPKVDLRFTKTTGMVEIPEEPGFIWTAYFATCDCEDVVEHQSESAAEALMLEYLYNLSPTDAIVVNAAEAKNSEYIEMRKDEDLTMSGLMIFFADQFGSSDKPFWAVQKLFDQNRYQAVFYLNHKASCPINETRSTWQAAEKDCYDSIERHINNMN